MHFQYGESVCVCECVWKLIFYKKFQWLQHFKKIFQLFDKRHTRWVKNINANRCLETEIVSLPPVHTAGYTVLHIPNHNKLFLRSHCSVRILMLHVGSKYIWIPLYTGLT